MAQLPAGYCLMLSDHCVWSEAMGLWSSLGFYALVFVVTIVHLANQDDVSDQRRYPTATENSDGGRVDVALALGGSTTAIAIVTGSLLCALGDLRYVHAQSAPIQWAGVAMLWACAAGFVRVHLDLGSSWLPEPGLRARHELVTNGAYRYARHPMYAIFFWATVGAALASLNWLLVAAFYFPIVLMVFPRIAVEEV